MHHLLHKFFDSPVFLTFLEIAGRPISVPLHKRLKEPGEPFITGLETPQTPDFNST